MTKYRWPACATLALACLVSLAACSDDVATSVDAVDADADADAPDTPDTTDAADTAIDPTPDAERPAPTEPGPHVVGYRKLTVRYDPLGDADERELDLAIWYPASEETGRSPLYFDLFRQPGVHVDAPLIAGDDFPILLYSHGHLGFAEVSSFLTEFFASHGWVVAAPDHTGNTSETISTPRVTAIYHDRPTDISAVLDALYALDGGDPLADALSENVVVSGHSFGGYTALALAGASYDIDTIAPNCADESDTSEFCSEMDSAAEAIFRAGLGDERIDAAIAMAAGDYRLFASGVAAVDIPVLHLTGALDESTTRAGDGDPIWLALDGEDDVRVDFATGAHHTFADTCDLGLELGDGCGPGFVPWQEAQPAINAYALAFARRHAQGIASAAALFEEGAAPLHEDITVSLK